MTTINELVTRLTFKQDKAGIRAYEAGLTGISKTAAKVAASSAVSFEKMTAKNSKNFGSMGKLMERVMAGSFGKIVSAGSKAFMGLESRFAKLRSTMGRGLQATVKLHGLDKETSKVNDLYGKLMKTAGLLTGGLTAGAVAKKGFDTAVSYEDMLAGLVTATGSQQQAEKEFARLQDFAKRTPFGVKESVTAFTRLKNLNLDASEETMMAYGNIASAIPGKTMMDFTEAVADAVTGEFERLKEFGMKASKDDGNVTIRFRGQAFNVAATKDGQIDEKGVEKQLRSMSQQFFGGAMERRSKTVGGAVAELADTIEAAYFRMWRAGLDKPITEAIRNITKHIEKFMPKMEALARSSAVFIKQDLPKYLDAIKALLPWIGTGLAVMYAHTVGITTLKFALWLWNAEKAMRGLGFATAIFNGAIALIPTIIGGIVLAVAAFGADFVYWMNTGESMILKFTERWPGVNQAIESAYESWQIFYYALQIGFENIGAWFGNLIGDFVQGFKDWRQNAINTKNLIVEAFTLVGDSIKGVYDWFVALHDKMVGFFNALAEKFPLLKSVADSVDGLLNRVLGGDDHDGHNHGNPNTLTKTEQELMKFVYPTMVRMGRGAASHGYQARDVAVPVGQAVRAASSGTVARVFNDPTGYGQTVILRHLNGLETLYAHNSKLLVKVGDQIQKGQQIALSGNTGRSTGPHGHFELRRNGRQVSIAQNMHLLQPTAQMPSAAPAPAGGGKGGSTITVQQNFNGPAQPNAVKRATQDGVTQALNKAAAGSPKPKAVG